MNTVPLFLIQVLGLPNLTLDMKRNDANSEIYFIHSKIQVRAQCYHKLINIKILLIPFSFVRWRFMFFL